MILAGHAIKITNSEDFKNEFSSDLWQEILTNRKKNLDTTYYYHYSLAKKGMDYGAEWWMIENDYIRHKSLEDYYKYLNPIINYTDI